MNDPELDQLSKLLKDTVPRVQNLELQRDLWPKMLQRLDQSALRIPWWDWALLAGVSALFILFPGLLPAVLYHL